MGGLGCLYRLERFRFFDLTLIIAVTVQSPLWHRIWVCQKGHFRQARGAKTDAEDVHAKLTIKYPNFLDFLLTA